MMTEAMRHAIDDALRRALGPARFDHVDVREDYDHADEPALFLDIVTKTGADDLSARESIETQMAVSNALLALGDTRFPYLSFKFPGDEYAVDDIRAPDAKPSAAH
ncbi:hypothetical protein [Methylosinus sp. Ce-a6]|uniref:hypothetical protein n=1 Tax=Methylosinus sp. Ce-a6 TaxID=2172005 RepID=UPI001356B9F8|nr:hypothetical protein [Methylosinus sp. Ce-a6]